MQINLATIEHHASEKLKRIESQPSAAERLIALKKFLKIETQRLHLRHRFGGTGSEIVAARSLLVDLLIQRIARSAVEERLGGAVEVGNFAVVALGGYGRQELSPQSDIDVLFLYQGRKDADRAARLSEAILYLLWDMGFSVGHSVRSLNECISIAKEDVISRNSMIDARRLWGSGDLFEMMVERLDEEVFEKQKRALLDEQLVERQARYNKFGDAACLQEPNVKETAGGLRDLHELLWMARTAYGSSSLKELAAKGAIPERDAKAIGTAYDFLLRVRNEIHFLTNRKSDLLSLDLQQQIARNLRYADTPEQQASELFMRDYYLHARRMHRLCEAHIQRAASNQEKDKQGKEKKGWFSRVRSSARVAPAIGGFVMRDGELDMPSLDKTDELPASMLDGNRLMLAFSYAQATGAGFSSNLQEAVQSALPTVNKTFRSSPEAAQAFLKMLRTKGRVAAGLRLMHD
nr:DUF294 nucleotidyltransferase-like domain-containing protein [Acidobacteriota bacterium]